MAVWDDLTDNEKDILATTSRLARDIAIQHQRAVNAMKNFNNQWAANAGAINATLDPTVQIPDGNRLQGSEILTANDLSLLASYYQNHNENHAAVASVTPDEEGYEWDGYATQRSKAGGPTNMV